MPPNLSKYPRPDFSGDYLAAGFRAGPGKIVVLNSSSTIVTLETLPVSCGVYANQVYSIDWFGDFAKTQSPTSDLYFRLAASYGVDGLQNVDVEINTWQFPVGSPNGPVPYLSAVFVCPANYNTVSLSAQALCADGTVVYGSAPGGQFFGIRPIGDSSSIIVVTT